VLGGGATTHLLLGAGTGDAEAWFLLPSGHPGAHVTARAPVDFSRPLAGVRLTGAVAAPGDILTGLRTAAVRDLAATLFCAEAAGVAGHCCDTAAAYARTRHQFGRPIGSFQAIKHKCADMLLEVESGKSAAYYASWAAAEDNDELPVVAALSKAYCSEAYFHAAAENIQIHGGIGFTWEHPAHLYFKRAKSSELLLGDPTYHRELLAQRIGI